MTFSSCRAQCCNSWEGLVVSLAVQEVDRIHSGLELEHSWIFVI